MLPSRADTVNIEVTLAMIATSVDSVSQEMVSTALEGKLGGADTSSIRNFVVQFTSVRRLLSSPMTYATRSLGTATVTFEVKTSLASVGYSDAASFQRALEDDLEGALSDGSLSTDLQVSCGCDDVSALAVSVVTTREYPTQGPTPLPSAAPSYLPSPAPSLSPQLKPSIVPISSPSAHPTLQKSQLPTSFPSALPSARPTHLPSSLPSREPSPMPSLLPSHVPLPAPSAFPSSEPTQPPTPSPSALPTSNLALNAAFSVSDVESASANPLVTGGIFILCVSIAIMICRTVYKKGKAAKSRGSEKEEGSIVKDIASVASEAALLAQLQAETVESGLNDAGTAEIDPDDVEFVDKEAARPPVETSPETSAVSELETMAQKHAEEIERFKLSTEAKMKIRLRKMNRLETTAEQEAAKAADYAAQLEEAKQEAKSKASKLVEVTENQDALQTKVAVQDKKPSMDAASDDDEDFQLPTLSPRVNRRTTAIPTELLKGLIGDSADSESKEGGAAKDDDPRARVMKAAESVGGAGNVRVAVRVRPPNQRELAGEGKGVCVDVNSADGIVKVGGDKAFTFDVAFSMEATQAEVFDNLGVDLVGWVLGGFNASVFAYGQTSSGKTHSMMGLRDSDVLKGLIPRIIALLWECVQAFLDENSKHDCVLKASYLEIYNEEIRDLLGNCEKLKLRNDPKKGIFANGLTMIPLKSGEEAMECIERGAQLRSVAATKFNSESSRSHAVFELHISKTYPTESGDMVSTSRLSLTDLAGSERSSKVGTSGTSLQEGNNINKSLSTLGRCITALVDISQGKKVLAPFRDSVLTLYLRDALAGNVLTTMLANVSPVSSNMDETVSTLRFAASAKRIKTKVTKNEDSQQKRIRELTEELEDVKKELAVQIRLAEGTKRLMRHLNGEVLPASPEDRDEPKKAVEESAVILRRAIADRRGSTRDATFVEANDQPGSAASVPAVSEASLGSMDLSEVPPLSNSSTQSQKTPLPRQHPQSSPSSMFRNQLRKSPPRPRPRLADRKAALEEKQSHNLTL